MWVPNWGGILQLRADQCVIGSLSYLLLVGKTEGFVVILAMSGTI